MSLLGASFARRAHASSDSSRRPEAARRRRRRQVHLARLCAPNGAGAEKRPGQQLNSKRQPAGRPAECRQVARRPLAALINLVATRELRASERARVRAPASGRPAGRASRRRRRRRANGRRLAGTPPLGPLKLFASRPASRTPPPQPGQDVCAHGDASILIKHRARRNTTQIMEAQLSKTRSQCSSIAFLHFCLLVLSLSRARAHFNALAPN